MGAAPPPTTRRLTQVNQPLTVLGGLQIGGPVSLVAGVLLIALGIREYYGRHLHGGHSHSEDSHNHSHDDHAHSEHNHSHASSGVLARLKGILPFVGGHSHSHGHSDDEFDEAAERGLLGIAWFAFLLGFAHEEEFEIIALCAGSDYCLELISAYSLTVIFGIVGLTMLLVAGYECCEEQVKQYTPYLPAFSAAVLVIMGFGFITGLF